MPLLVSQTQIWRRWLDVFDSSTVDVAVSESTGRFTAEETTNEHKNINGFYKSIRKRFLPSPAVI